MEKNKKKYLKFCKYYKGEDLTPYENGPNNTANQQHGMFWFYERHWCHASEQEHEQHTRDYINDGLINFEKNDGTPISLKGLLYNRYCHWSGYGDDVENFKRWYVIQYLNKKIE